MNATLRLVPILAIVLLAGACAAPPALRPLDPALASSMSEVCGRPFLKGPQRLVHSLEFELAGGRKGVAVGVLVADPGTRTFRTVLMTLEGWVLFDIEGGESLTVHRAVPPFDAPGFAPRMAQDIRLAFFSPKGASPVLGREEKGSPVCRFDREGGGFTDLVRIDAGRMALRLYDAGGELRKSATFRSFNNAGLPSLLEIRSEDPSYTLRLTLLESEVLAAEGDVR